MVRMIAWYVLDGPGTGELMEFIQSRSRYVTICWRSGCQRHLSQTSSATSALTGLVIIANSWSGSEIEPRTLGFEAML